MCYAFYNGCEYDFRSHKNLSIKLDDKTINFDRENTCGPKQQTVPPDPQVNTASVDNFLKKVLLKFELSNVQF